MKDENDGVYYAAVPAFSMKLSLLQKLGFLLNNFS